MLATKISFMNDIANLCEVVGADVNMVRKGIGSDTRIGNKFIYPGAGYGGSCFPKDVKALIKTGDEYGRSLEILKAVELVNDNQKSVIPRKIRSHFGDKLKGKKLGLWGLSFKPHTDDMREAPSIRIIEELLESGVSINAYDPVAMDEARRILGDVIEYSIDKYEALIDSDGLIVVTEWPEFRVLNYKVLDRLMREKVIFDGRNIYEAEELQEYGFTYYSIGKQPVTP
jgi:UDPglucose 6-dehydrogenase